MRKAAVLDPDFAPGRFYLTFALVQAGELADALVQAKHTLELSASHPAGLSAMTLVHAAAGRKAAVRKEIERMEHLSMKQHVAPYFIALAYAALGETVKTFEWLERAFVERSGWLWYVKNDPVFDALRSDPRLSSLVQRVDPSPGSAEKS